MALSVSINKQQQVTIVSLQGYLSASSAGPLESAMADVERETRLIVGFQESDVTNSAGIAVLFDLLLDFKEAGGDVRVSHPSAHFRKVFRIMGLNQDIDIVDSVDAALAGWAESDGRS